MRGFFAIAEHCCRSQSHSAHILNYSTLDEFTSGEGTGCINSRGINSEISQDDVVYYSGLRYDLAVCLSHLWVLLDLYRAVKSDFLN